MSPRTGRCPHSTQGPALRRPQRGLPRTARDSRPPPPSPHPGADTQPCLSSPGFGAPRVPPQQARTIVNNALKLYSQDKTGVVDFALESGGESPGL